MSETDSKFEASAEEAYAEAAAAVPVQEIAIAQTTAETTAVAPVAPAKQPVVGKATPARRAAAKPAKKAKSVAKPAAVATATAAKKPAPAAKKKIHTETSNTPNYKEKTMPKNAKIVEGIKQVVADAQAKAMKAVEQGSSLFGEASEFTKGNVAAVVESGKILATGLQSMGKDFVVEGRSAFETVTGDVKQIAAVRSPVELFKVQSEIAAKNLDAAIALGSKNSEAAIKLASAVLAPISGRFGLAVEKLRKLAA